MTQAHTSWEACSSSGSVLRSARGPGVRDSFSAQGLSPALPSAMAMGPTMLSAAASAATRLTCPPQRAYECLLQISQFGQHITALGGRRSLQ